MSGAGSITSHRARAGRAASGLRRWARWRIWSIRRHHLRWDGRTRRRRSPGSGRRSCARGTPRSPSHRARTSTGSEGMDVPREVVGEVRGIAGWGSAGQTASWFPGTTTIAGRPGSSESRARARGTARRCPRSRGPSPGGGRRRSRPRGRPRPPRSRSTGPAPVRSPFVRELDQGAAQLGEDDALRREGREEDGPAGPGRPGDRPISGHVQSLHRDGDGDPDLAAELELEPHDLVRQERTRAQGESLRTSVLIDRNRRPA